MKRLIINLFLFNLFIIYSGKAIAQENYADSLKKVLETEKEDTNKVFTLEYLYAHYLQISDYKNAMQCAQNVGALATRINFKIGIADGYLYIGMAYNIKKR